MFVNDRNYDCYRLCDWLVTWWGEKVAERQDVCREMIRKNSLYTPYAAEKIGRQEFFAREGVMKLQRQGNGTYLITENMKDDTPRNRSRGRDAPITRVERNTVNTRNKTCTCHFVREHRLPCKHVILVVDFLKQRSTNDGQIQFRKDWVAPYFWRENYVNAYADVVVHAPEINNDIAIDLCGSTVTCLN